MGVALVGAVIMNNRPFPRDVKYTWKFDYYSAEHTMGCFVAKRLKRRTTDQEVPGSGPADNRDFFFLFRVHPTTEEKGCLCVLWKRH